jgi:ribosome-associated protein
MKSEALLNEVLRVLEDKKGQQITALNLQGISLLADYFVICHGNSVTQVQALAAEIRKKAGELGVHVRGIEGLDAAKWVLIDLGDVVVHIFHKDEREYYNLERLWSDAKVVEHA